MTLIMSVATYSSPRVSAASNEETIYNYMRNTMGVNCAVACGVLANIKAESGFNPTASCIDTNGLTSYGICQWNGGRFTNLKNFCSNRGLSYSNINAQLQFLKYELEGSESSAWAKVKSQANNASGAYTAGYNWAKYFERCASSYYTSRANSAQNTYWPKYGGTTVTLTSDSKYSSFKGFKAYPCVSENFYCYNSDLTTSPGRIYTTDYCTINDVYTNGWCKVACPWSDGTTKTVYTKISNFIKTPSTSVGSFTSQTYINLYSTTSMSTKIFRIYPNDVCYTIGTSGSATQVFMPHSDGYYVLGWIQTSEIPSSSSSYSIDSRYPTPFKCRVLSSSKVPAALTVGGARQSDMNVYVDDDCVITEVYTNGWCKFTCPWSDGSTKTLYLPLSEFINANIEPYTFTATQYTDTYYKSDKATKVGWIDVGDSVTVVSTSGSVSQAIYPADVGKRCGWANTSALTATYSVSYNANGGTGAPSSQSKTPGTALTLSTTKPTRTGYTFVGWATISSATTASYTAGSTYTTDASVTLYAVWKQITYIISYDLCGGTGDIAEQTKAHGTDIKITTVVPLQNGYTFDGWNTAVDGSGVSYSPGSIYSENNYLTLYAQWSPITYTIKYDANGGNNPPSEQIKTYGVDIAISEICPSRDGYTFLGWNTEKEADTATYLSGNEFSLDENVTLYAIWSENTLVETSKISLDSLTVHAGEEFTVDVNIENNPGFCYLKLRLNYDSDLFEFIEAINGTVSTDSFSSTTEALLWDSDKNTTADGTLVTLKFKAKDNLAEGEYNLGVNFVEGYDYDEEDVTFGVNNATITVVEFIYGDVTGDNVINGKDLVRLRKYLLTLDETTGTADVEISLGADTTGDGVVNGKDLVRLRKYLLNYDEATGTSPIVLGPTS